MRMKERKVSEEDVKTAVLQPTNWSNGKDGEIVAIRKFGKKEIRVAYLSEPAAIKIITVMRK